MERFVSWILALPLLFAIETSWHAPHFDLFWGAMVVVFSAEFLVALSAPFWINRI